jgi:hypothetical protein
MRQRIAAVNALLMNRLRAGGSASFTASMEGWGASGKVEYQDMSSVRVNTKTVTATVTMNYTSEQIDMIDPTCASQDVALLPEAGHVLKEQGPEKFHSKYGSHFVAGYTKGNKYLRGAATFHVISWAATTCWFDSSMRGLLPIAWHFAPDRCVWHACIDVRGPKAAAAADASK